MIASVLTDAIAIALWIALLPLLAAAGYLALLALLALLPRPKRESRAAPARRFALVIPAHNEQQALPFLLESIAALDYPPELIDVTVVADNCDDDTALLARAAGARVLERTDDERIGKGYALAYALEHVPSDATAVVFIDGDCTVSPNLLRAFDQRLAAGDDVVQSYYSMKRPSAASNVVLRELALALVHLLRPLGKARFGASAGLKGSGMCFSRAALARVDWQSFGLAEDVEQHTRVVRAGMRVGFAPEALVLGESPSALHAASSQHRRWEAGRLSAARTDGVALLVEGLRTRSLVRVDAAIELLVPPISILGAGLPVLAVAGYALGAETVAPGAALGMAALALYVVAGVAVSNLSVREVVRAFSAMPRYIIWKLWLYGQAVASKPERWERTPRIDAEPLPEKP